MQKALNVGLRSPEQERRRELLLGVATALATLFCVAVPRVGPLVVASVLGILTGILLVQNIRRREVADPIQSYIVRPEVPFIAWVFIACLWAVEPGAALSKALLLAILIFTAIFLSKEAHRLSRSDIKAISRGLLVGFILGGIYLCLETVMRDVITRIVLTYVPELDRGMAKHATVSNGEVVKVGGAHVTRVATAFCLFLCPAALAAMLYTKGAVRWFCYALMALFSLVIVFHPSTKSQTAELILVISLASFLCAVVSPKITRWLLGAGFAACVFLIVPASLAMFSLRLHENPDVFSSARARVVIWDYTADRILENPILGVGTNSTKYIDEARPKQEKVRPKDLVAAPATRAHPHNVYLQIWYELGVIGAVAFAVLGLSLLGQTTSVPREAVPFAITHFAICMAIIAPTYGLWQNWFQSAIALSILALIVTSGAGSLGRDAKPMAAPLQAPLNRAFSACWKHALRLWTPKSRSSLE